MKKPLITSLCLCLLIFALPVTAEEVSTNGDSPLPSSPIEAETTETHQTQEGSDKITAEPHPLPPEAEEVTSSEDPSPPSEDQDPAPQAPKITIMVEDKAVVCDQEPFISEGRTMVPLRAIFEALGAHVYYDDATRAIVATHKDRDRLILMIVNQPYMAVTSYQEAHTQVHNGTHSYQSLGLSLGKTATKIDVPPMVTPQGRTMVPVRVVSEALGSFVSWEAETYTVWVD